MKKEISIILGILGICLGLFLLSELNKPQEYKSTEERGEERIECIKEYCPFGPIIANSFIFDEKKGGYNYSEIEEWMNELRMAWYFKIDEYEFIENVKVYENDSNGVYWILEKKYPRYKSYKFQCEYLRECEMRW